MPGRDATVDATAATGTPLIDLDDYICDDECPAIIGNVLVYRDSHHLTASFAAERRRTKANRLSVNCTVSPSVISPQAR